MEPIKQLKIDIEKEIVASIQIYLMNLLNTHDVVYDIDGEVINEINASPYCKTLHFISERNDYCRNYSWELSKSAICLKKPFEDRCPGGLTLLSMPICIDENTVIGAHCITTSNSPRSRFNVYDIAEQYRIEAHILWDAVKKTPLIPKPVLKIARELGISSTELMSRVLARIYTLKQNELAIAKKYHSIEEIIKKSDISK